MTAYLSLVALTDGRCTKSTLTGRRAEANKKENNEERQRAHTSAAPIVRHAR